MGLTDWNPNPIVNFKPFFTFTFNHQILSILFVKLSCYQSSYFHVYYPQTINSCLNRSLPCSRLMCSPNKLVFIHKHVPLPALPKSPTSTLCIQPARWWITRTARRQGYHTSLKTELNHVNSNMGPTEPRKCSFLKGGIESASQEKASSWHLSKIISSSKCCYILITKRKSSLYLVPSNMKATEVWWKDKKISSNWFGS